MRAHEQDLVVEEDGFISLELQPLRTGDRVKVIVLFPEEVETRTPRYPLRGQKPYSFIDPTAPVAPEDWE